MTDQTKITIEAEDMNMHNFYTVGGRNASDGELVRLGAGKTGDLETTFDGEAGIYDFNLRAQDETDGQSTVMVKVNGVVVATIVLDKDSNGGGSNNGGFTNFSVEGLELQPGDKIGLWAQADGGEMVRLDKIELTKTAETNEAPTFDNLPENGQVMIDENTTAVIDVNASDADGDAITYSIVGGADQSFFTIDPHTGQLSFISGPDFEAPEDGNGNNKYDVTIQADDGNGGVTQKTLWVEVKDVDEVPAGEHCDPIVIEAEDMHLNNFVVVGGANASGGELVRLRSLNNDGSLETAFSGPDGSYDLTIRAQDESDGQSKISVFINGIEQETFVLDQDNNGRGSNNGQFSDFNIEGLNINTGDVVSIRVWGKDGEYARIDNLTFTPIKEEPVDPNLVCIDFEGLNAGDVVNTQFDGVMISAQRDGEGGSNSTSPNDAMIFDGANPTGGDTDLTASGDNVLIISEDNDSSDPDDNAAGGTVWFKFDNPSFIDSVAVIDAEEGGSIRLLDENGQLIEEVNIPVDVDGGIQTIDINIDGVAQIDLTLNGSGAIDDLKFIPGEDPALGSIGGTYFMDNNDNSIQDDADMGLAGQTVWLLEVGVGVVATTTTDANGNYIFEGLDAGDYFVRFDGNNVDGKTLVDSNVGNDDTVDSDIDNTGSAGNHNTGVINLGQGENVTDVDAGVEDPGTAAINGRLFMDNNDNSIEDGADMGLGGLEIELLDENGDVIATATTNDNGEYTFNGLGAGDYSVRFPEEVDGKVLVEQNVGADDTVDSDADQDTGETGTISLDIGEVSNDNDAGVVDPGTASLGGTFFMDNNDNSVEDGGDMAVAGATVFLSVNGAVVAVTTTDANGNYLFEDLEAGDYSVHFEGQDGKSFVDANVGNNDTIDSDVTVVGSDGTGNTDTISLSIGEDVRNVDAGVELIDTGDAAIEGVVFMDNNDNSQNDAGDMGLGGVIVTLLDENGDVVTTTATGDDGSYSFTDLPAGTYSVTFPTEVDGKVLVEANVGPDATDSDADEGTGNTGPITVGIGETSSNNDAGVEDPGTASVAGRYFMDMNDNSRDDGEPGVANATVWLILAGTGVVASTTTDANGEYLFEGLDAGSYRVRFEDPTDVDGQEGKVFVDANVGDDINDSDAEVDDSDVTVVGGAGNGNTAFFPVEIGDAITDVDAGIEDPGTAAIGDRVFLDENGNGQQDAGEAGVAGVDVTVFDADGNVVGTDTTDANGDYLVDGLDAGDYTVAFEEVDGFDFTTANQGDDATDSDADQTTGITGAVTLEIGETNLTVDAGLVAENEAPVAGDDEAAVCANDSVNINVLGNDTDPDGDPITVAHVNGVELAVGESTTIDSGAIVTLNADGTLGYDSSTAVIDGVPVDEIIQNETAVDSFTYSISDGQGGVDTGTVDVTVKGDMDTVETIVDSLPTTGEVTFSGFNFGDAYTATIFNTGDARLDGLVIEAAYCLELEEDFFSGQDVTVDISGALDNLLNPGDFTNNVDGNLDLINYILNQDFTSMDNGDGTGTNYTDAEIQGAIWGITDNDPFVAEVFDNGTIANAQEIIDMAIANGEGFVPGEGGVFGLIVNPTDVQAGIDEANDFDQAFILALSFDDFQEDCICL